MDNLNLVILGLPSSGKSALLGALQQAAQTKGTALEGSLVDVTGELEQLRQSSLSNKYQPTRTAVTAYPMQRHVDGRDETVTLLDTSGVDAAAVLSGQEDLAGSTPLPHALADADGVLLVVDVSTSANELKNQFGQFVQFFNAWQTQRGKAAKVGGLPVFLVLAKCDKIAREGESFGQWTQRVEDAKRKVGEQLRKSLEASRDRSFGRVDVRVWATAAKRPVADKPSRLGEPYQVAELFSQVFDAAETYRERSERSSQTLQGALIGLGGAVAFLLLTIGWYFATEPSLDVATLEKQVASLVGGGEDSSADRVREPIDERLKELHAVKADPAYPQLPERIRDQIATTENDLLEYQRLNGEYLKKVKNPRFATTKAELVGIIAVLAQYDDALKKWPDTRLAKRHETSKVEAEELRRAIDAEIAWMRDRENEGDALDKLGLEVKKDDATQLDAWSRKALKYKDDSERNHHEITERIKGTTIPYRVVYEFDEIKKAKARWLSAVQSVMNRRARLIPTGK